MEKLGVHESSHAYCMRKWLFSSDYGIYLSTIPSRMIITPNEDARLPATSTGTHLIFSLQRARNTDITVSRTDPV